MVSAFQWMNSASVKQDRGLSPSDRIAQAFDAASQSTGTSFDYLLKTAVRESSLNPEAKAGTSSAAGLFQFIESTWLETVKESGAEYGLGAIADAIRMDADGRYTVSDPGMRDKILALRHDPEVASMMAGALTRRNAGYLEGRLGRSPSEGELYIAHFMGARGAAALIGINEQAPSADAVQLFPKHAAANRPIFYEDGRRRSVSEVYADLVSRHTGSSQPSAAIAFAPDAGRAAAPAATVAFSAQPVSEGFFRSRAEGAFAGLFSDPAPGATVASGPTAFQIFAMAPALFEVAAAEDTSGLIEDPRPVPRPAAVPAPQALASSQSSAAPQASASLVESRPAAPSRGPLDLTRFIRPSGE